MTQLLMLTMSSSGGKWLAGAIAKHLPGCRYYDKEFFNPICNMKYEPILSTVFGSELVGCYKNIARTGGDRGLEVIDKTWGQEQYTFTKECFSPLKLPLFVQRFRCFCLLRRTEDCLPPLRLRVWSFYEHCWFAFRGEGYAMRATTTKERAIEAHRLMYREIDMSAESLGVPVLRFEDMMDGSPAQIESELQRAVGFSSPELVYELTSTRYREKRG